MKSIIAIPKTPCSGPGQFLTLVGYSSVLAKDYLNPVNSYQSRDLPHNNFPTPDSAPSLSI